MAKGVPLAEVSTLTGRYAVEPTLQRHDSAEYTDRGNSLYTFILKDHHVIEYFQVEKQNDGTYIVRATRSQQDAHKLENGEAISACKVRTLNDGVEHTVKAKAAALLR